MTDVNAAETHYIKNFLRILLNNTLKEIMSLTGAESGSFLLFDPKSNELVLDSFYNSHEQYLEGLRKKLGEGISGKVIDIKTPVLVKDINADGRFKHNGFSHYSTNSFISVPLFNAQGLLGIVNIADKASKESFSEKDLEVAQTLCKYACITGDNLLQLERLRQEREILCRQKAELEKYASVGKIAAGVVHEINSPLDGIIRFTNILLNQSEDNSIAREYLLEIKSGLERITHITQSLLIFSYHTNSATLLHMKKYVSLNKLLDDALDIFTERINHTITVKRDFRGSMPRILDMGLQYVFTNIIKNALDAMPEKGTLTINSDIRDALIEIRIKDTGSGMAQEIISRIFEPFFTTKSIDKGTGLGLAICREIINKYEGKISVESEAGKGSTFVILIPSKHFENE
jgi:signal transduction histidine kinase